jgi:protein-L-isoaspartate(D-aspartate) O-methyltransferase
VLEIGTGTGYNAALLACLVGERGHVASVEINEELCERAKRNLEIAGCAERVTVVPTDGRKNVVETSALQ